MFHINRVVYFESSLNTIKNWCTCVISSLSHHISNQGNEPPSVDKGCQQKPIIGYPRIWYTSTRLLLKSTTGVPLLLPPAPPPCCFFCSHLFAPSHDLNTWNRLQKHPYNLPTFLTLFIVNASKHVMCHIKQHLLHLSFEICPRKNNLCCLFDSGGQQSNWWKLSKVENPGFQLSFPKQLLVIVHTQTQLYPYCNVIRNVWRALCVFRTGELPIIKKYPYMYYKKGLKCIDVHLCTCIIIIIIVLICRHSDVCCLNNARRNSTTELKLVKVNTKFDMFSFHLFWL